MSERDVRGGREDVEVSSASAPRRPDRWSFFFKRAAPRRAARDDAPVSIGDDTIGVRIVMFFVSFVVRSTSVAAKLMCPGGKMTSSYV